MGILKKRKETGQILDSNLANLVILTELLISYQSYTWCMKIIPGDRPGNKGFIQKSFHLLQSKQSTQHSPRTCYLLYSSTSSLGLNLSPHFINHSPRKPCHPNTIHFQFAFGIIQKLNHQDTRQSVQPNSQSWGWDVPAQPHNTGVIPKSVFDCPPKLVPKPALWISHM